MYLAWGEHVDTGVVMALVVPLKKGGRPSGRIRQTTKPIRVTWTVLQCFEGGFGEWIVVGDVWS